MIGETKKATVRQLLSRLGLRVEKAKYHRYSYDRGNFVELHGLSSVTIFDVGANVGQSAIWLTRSFPQATVYAFEPFAAIFHQLAKTVAGQPRIKPFPLALGARNETIMTKKVTDAETMVARIDVSPAGDEAREQVTVRTIDSFCAEQGISHVHVLKSDTEGHDVAVLQGARQLLTNKRVSNILAEATIRADREHTSLHDLTNLLAEFDYEPFSLYDVMHDGSDGGLVCFNVLFKPRTAWQGSSGSQPTRAQHRGT